MVLAAGKTLAKRLCSGAGLRQRTPGETAKDHQSPTRGSIVQGAAQPQRTMDIGHQLDRMKESFLWAAAKGGREEEVESLLSIGADVNWRNGDEGETPLIAACRSGHRGVAALLLAHGGDAMGTSRNGESALHAACRRGDEDLCALLVDAGAHDEGAFEAGVSAGHGAMVSRLRGLGRRHAAAAQASSRRPPPSIRSAALPAVEVPRRSPRRRDPAQELLEEVRSGYRERAADAAERRMRDDEPPACPTPQAVDIVAARLDEAAKGRRAEQQKRERAQREADAARAQSNQLLAELMQAQTVASKLREKETNLKRDLRRLRGRGLSGLEVEELASLERDLRAALRRVTLAKEKRLKASVHVPDGYVCPITREMMRDPVFCGDGHTYERDAISVWLMTKDTSPKTGCVLESKALIPNFALRSAIDDLRNRRRLADEVADEDDAKTLPASPG